MLLLKLEILINCDLIHIKSPGLLAYSKLGIFFNLKSVETYSYELDFEHLKTRFPVDRHDLLKNLIHVY